MLQRKQMSPCSRASSAIDQLTGGQARELSVEATNAITAAFASVVTALEYLAEKCREQQLDPTKILPMLMAGGAAGVSAQQEVNSVATIVDEEVTALLVRRSHDLIDALDRGEAMVIDGALASSFIYFDGGRVKDRDAILASIRERASTVPYVARRTWVEEQVVGSDGTYVFMGKVHETQGGNDTHGGYVYEGWYVLQWALVADSWRVQLLTWQKELTDREWWNDTFNKGRGFSREPNRLLVESVEAIAPGDALDLAMGQGRNAVYLASHGWSVVGVDNSDEGLRLAREEAAKRGLSIEIVHADIDEWDFGTDRFDLVTMIYAGDEAAWIERIKSSLRSGGMFVVEGWAKSRSDSSVGFGEGQLAQLFSGYEVLRDEIVDNEVPDWACDTGKLVRFVALKR